MDCGKRFNSCNLLPILTRLQQFRKESRLSAEEVEERLLLGPGWIARFESGGTVPSLDLLFTLIGLYGRKPEELFQGADNNATGFRRSIFAEQEGLNLQIRFAYAQYDALYTLENAQLSEYEDVIKTLRNGLAQLVGENNNLAEQIKADSVATTFLKAIDTWPHANPSDLWWFLVYRAYFDPFNHPAAFARLDLGQSWKRTGGWALETVLVRFYAPFLKSHGIDLFIASSRDEKQTLVNQFHLGVRAEADKIDVFLASRENGRRVPFGVVHVKASFAERRTDDVPLSQALVNQGYVSPLWTMDCKSTPCCNPVNKGELGVVLQGNKDCRSAKRKDIEDDAFFSACFSYNRNTAPTPPKSKTKAKVYVCNFRSPDDAFSRFIIDSFITRQELLKC